MEWLIRCLDQYHLKKKNNDLNFPYDYQLEVTCEANFHQKENLCLFFWGIFTI